MVFSLGGSNLSRAVPALVVWWMMAQSATAVTSEERRTELVEWIRSNGGYFNDKIEMRRMDPSNDQSPFGVFAKETLTEQELLLHVPRKCYLELRQEDILDIDEDEMDIETIMDRYTNNTCRLSKLLKQEYVLGKNESKYGPYISYLETQQRGQLPATWSKQAKNIIRTMLHPGRSEWYGSNILPPWEGVDWIDNHFLRKGCIDPKDPLDEHMVALTVQRGYDTTLIPIWDMVNHNNGKLNTDTNSIYDKEGIKVWSRRRIQAGEEIYATYDYCKDCLDTGDYVGTPGIFRDFGFVESYPQVWPFLNLEVYFEIVEEEPYGKYAWFDQEQDMPTGKSLVFLQQHLSRLRKMKASVLMERGSIPQYQWDLILQFHQSFVDALDLAIEATSEIQNNTSSRSKFLAVVDDEDDGEEEDDEEEDEDDDEDEEEMSSEL